MTAQRLLLEEQAASQLGGSWAPRSFAAAAAEGPRRQVASGAAADSDDGSDDGAGQLAVGGAAETYGGSSGSTCVAGMLEGTGQALAMLEKMRLEQEAWETKMSEFKVGRPGSARLAVAPDQERLAAPAAGIVVRGTAGETLLAAALAAVPAAAAAAATPAALAPLVYTEAGSEVPPPVADEFCAEETGITEEGEVEAGTESESLIAAALRAAGVEASSAEEAMAELLRRAGDQAGAEEGELSPVLEEFRGAHSERRPSKTGSAAKRWAANRLRRKRGGLGTRSPAGSRPGSSSGITEISV